MSSTGVREEVTSEKRVIRGLIKNEEAFIQSLRVFANTSTLSGLGATGGEVNNSPNEASGNYLAKSGDFMVGQFGNAFDGVAATNLVDDTLDVSKTSGVTFPVVILQGEGLLDDDLVTIIQGEDVFPFQELWIRTRVNIITVKNSDNVNTPDGDDLVLPVGSIIKLIFDTFLGEWVIVAGNAVAGSGGGTGTFISADLTADQITNLAVNDHIEFDRNTAPTGADGGIVLQTGAGQANGIFELKSGKTYFLSAGVAPFFGATNHVEFVWFDITNGTELGRRTIQDDAILALDQPKAEISFTPLTDVNVEFRLVANTTPANLNGYDAEHTFANIFEFSGKNGTDGSPGASGAVTWKTPARAKTLIDVPNLASFDVITDGVTLVENDRVLLTEQVTASENGLYVVGVVAGGLAPLTRPTDFDTDAEVLSETFVAIEEGQSHRNQLWHLITNNPILIDVTGQLWEVFAPGTSGGPDMGGGADGIDGDGQFVNDGRIGIGRNVLKILERIELSAATIPEQRMNNLIYLPSRIGGTPGRLFVNGLSNGTQGGAFSDNYGESFTLSASLTSNLGYGRMAYAPNLGTFGTLVTIRTIAGGTSAAFSMQVSTDRGTSFSNITLDFSNTGQNFSDVIWSEEDSQFVGISFFDSTHNIYTSPDGAAWTRRVTPAVSLGTAWVRIVFSPSLGKYYVDGNGRDVSSSSEFIQSTDGITWTGPTANDERIGTPKRIIWSEGQQKFAAVGTLVFGGGQPIVEFSDDFITWTVSNPTDIAIVADIVWAPDLSLWVVVGTNDISGFASPFIWASNDGVSWESFPKGDMRTNPGSLSNERTQIVYAEEFDYFFACNSGFGTTLHLIFRTGQRR